MRGHLASLSGGAPREMVLHAAVQAPSLRRMWFNSPMTIDGLVTIEGMVAHAEAAGSLEVDLLGCRRVVYDLGWRDTEGALGRFFGWKSLDLRHPLRSTTELKGKVMRSGELVGHATLHFDLKDLPSFVRSFRLAR